MVPAVACAMVAGALFVLIAWTQASDAVGLAQRKDEARAERLAQSILDTLEQRASDLNTWASAHADLLTKGSQTALTKALRSEVSAEDDAVSIAWLVVAGDGSIVAAAEANPGRLAAHGVVDDVRVTGKLAAVRGKMQVSNRLKINDQYAFVIASPVESTKQSMGHQRTLAIVNVVYVSRSMIGVFLAGQTSSSVDGAVLMDRDGRVFLGAKDKRENGVDVVNRPVGETGWSIQFDRDDIDELLPSWAYPMFAALLLIFALAFTLQEASRRRLRRRDARAARTAHSLYELAARVLHANTIEEQINDLANASLDLADVDGARVSVQSNEEKLEGSAGITEPGLDEWVVPIVGPRGVLGELVVWRADAPFEPAEDWVLQTAAALVGAALETRVLLESERKVAAELQRLDELRSNLLTTVAHELLSPLTAVKGVLGLLAMQDDLGVRGREYVDVATERTDRLVALIRDLFDCSLLETGQLDIKPQRQRADELLDAALGAQAAARPGELRLSATPNLMINVDPVRFDQLVNNLVTNAFRHGAPPIEVAIRPGEGGTLVMVSDEGVGISEGDRAEVFGKFWQGSRGHAREAEGAGLGLSLVQGLVRVHGGDIRIDSTHADGRGARFIAFFPDYYDASSGQRS